MLDTFGVLIPTVIAFNVSDQVAVIVLFIALIIATVITVPVTIKYFKHLMQYKKEIEEANGSIPQFYKIYIRFTFLPLGFLLCLWFACIVMGADVLFDTKLF